MRQMNIVSKNHQNMLVQSDKVAFSSFDDKRFLMCAVHSLPYGHYRIARFMEDGVCCVCRE